MNKNLHRGLKNIGFVSTRFSGLDGVSLETAKWSEILKDEGFECFYFAGELDRPAERSFQVKKAHFKHPEIQEIYNECFYTRQRKRWVTKKIHKVKVELKEAIYGFIERFNISLLIVENALTIPLNIPLGIALTEVISETGMNTIAHHHDFFWERKRFLTNSVWDYLNLAFPPHLPSIEHVVINSSGDNQLSLRTGISATIIPNVINFEESPPSIDDYSCDVREAFGIGEDEYFILQPTRVVQRKGIEHAIELVRRLEMDAKLVISHASGDEGYEYEDRIRKYSNILGVDTLFVSQRINETRERNEKGEKIYTIWDIYPHADLVTYPSNFEGFGNAFLETIYFKKPIVVNSYSNYLTDIKPKGFDVIEFDGYITEESIKKTREILENTEERKKMVDNNYKLARKHFSYSILRRKLRSLLYEYYTDI